MHRYRAIARKLVIPFGLIPFDARVRMLDEGRMRILRRFLDGIDEAIAASNTVGLSFEAFGEQGAAIDLHENDAHRALRSSTDAWRVMELADDDAVAFSRELEALIERYATRGGPRTFVCHVGVAPEPAFAWRSANDRWT